MIITIKEGETSNLYNKAIKNYNACIYNDDNAYLRDEVTIALELIKVKCDSIHIKFYGEETEIYNIEINLKLYNLLNNEIGKYIYIQNKAGNFVDEFLIFY